VIAMKIGRSRVLGLKRRPRRAALGPKILKSRKDHVRRASVSHYHLALGALPQITQMGCKSSSITRKDIMLKSTRKSVPILMLMFLACTHAGKTMT